MQMTKYRFVLDEIHHSLFCLGGIFIFEKYPATAGIPQSPDAAPLKKIVALVFSAFS